MTDRPNEELMGVVLAAGKGTRMRPFSEHWPKPILPVLGKPLVAYQLEMMAALGIRRVVVPIDVSRSKLPPPAWALPLGRVPQSMPLGGGLPRPLPTNPNCARACVAPPRNENMGQCVARVGGCGVVGVF